MPSAVDHTRPDSLDTASQDGTTFYLKNPTPPKRNGRGSAGARPTLIRDWGEPQVKDPMPIVSVNPTRNPPPPKAVDGLTDRDAPTMSPSGR